MPYGARRSLTVRLGPPDALHDLPRKPRPRHDATLRRNTLSTQRFRGTGFRRNASARPAFDATLPRDRLSTQRFGATGFRRNVSARPAFGTAFGRGSRHFGHAPQHDALRVLLPSKARKASLGHRHVGLPQPNPPSVEVAVVGDDPTRTESPAIVDDADEECRPNRARQAL